MTLRDLENWLVHMLPVYLLNPGSEASNICGLIELGLAEIHAGIRTERSFKQLLLKHIPSNPIHSEPYANTGSMTMAIGTTAEAIPWEWAPSPSWSNEPQAEYA